MFQRRRDICGQANVLVLPDQLPTLILLLQSGWHSSVPLLSKGTAQPCLSQVGTLNIYSSLISDLALGRFPLYYHAKFVFLVWLQLPNNHVSATDFAELKTVGLPFWLAVVLAAECVLLLVYGCRELGSCTSHYYGLFSSSTRRD